MKTVQSLQALRRRAIEELVSMHSLRKGCLTEQWVPVVRDGIQTKELRGPYYVWTCKAGNKTVSKRITGEAEIEQARQDALNYRRFRQLCQELEELTHDLGVVERAEPTRDETVKKKSRRRSKQTRK